MKFLGVLLLLAILSPISDRDAHGQGTGWDWDLSQAHRAYLGPETSVVMVLPDGAGTPMSASRIVGGTVDSSITLYLIDGAGRPVANFPREDMWLISADGGVSACLGGTVADGPSNAAGEAYWTQPLHAGGASEALTVVVINGAALTSSAGLAISYNSPDINGDGVVNLTDVPLFAGDFHGGAYDFRSDFHYDGIVNLSDVVHMAQGLGSSCP